LLSHITLYNRGLFRLCGATMDSAWWRFNCKLLAPALLLALAGCASTGEQAPPTQLMVHAEAKDNSAFTRKVTLFRTVPVNLVVEQTPLLTGDDLAAATVVDTLGGFAIKLQFNSRGQWLLDHYSSLNLGRRVGIFTVFGEKKEQTARWLAAPVMSSRAADGILLFTPDATREEAERIVAGLQPKTKKAAADGKQP
jgi:hypothetical protein